ncbi:homocitrate synthase like protein [Zymoseptoria brevis]|uniref:Homocitrate synthase like protein n=1 Tax=Zymoseptoria brevis TaxID=1047168 RepID=A0A0F4G4T7_9PEZI|nr:homocitrate synthase like protein [Zymoseptoria brevis]
MVLHLLGKKSWNVYNTANVERVRKDEADAKAREEAEEQRQQEEDASRRIALLRGEHVAALTAETAEPEDGSEQRRRSRHDDPQRDRKRRRLRGEDDTDAEIRHARTDVEAERRAPQLHMKEREKAAPLQDHAGHIQLIPAPDEVAVHKAEKNAEAEAEKAKKRMREDDQVTMRFSNAAGYQNGMQKPWYAATKEAAAPVSASMDLVLADVQGKDVWGNDDPRRKERESQRMSSNDPFAAMQQAQRQLKQSSRDKEAWQKQQAKEIEELKRSQRRDEERRRREDSLDGFSLDAPAEKRLEAEREIVTDIGGGIDQSDTKTAMISCGNKKWT